MSRAIHRLELNLAALLLRAAIGAAATWRSLGRR
jgi:hypothetical protein